VVDTSRRHGFENDEAHTGEFRRQRKLRHGRSQRRRSNSRCPAEHAPIMVHRMRGRNARMPVRRSTEARRYGAAFDARSAGDMMMQNRDGKLDAKGYQRQPDQIRAGSRSLHRALSSPWYDSSRLVSLSWQPIIGRCLSGDYGLTESKRRLISRRSAGPPPKDAGGAELDELRSHLM
jgi:hypothetical protein